MKERDKFPQHPLGMERPVLKKSLVPCVAGIYIVLLERAEMRIALELRKQ